MMIEFYTKTSKDFGIAIERALLGYAHKRGFRNDLALHALCEALKKEITDKLGIALDRLWRIEFDCLFNGSEIVGTSATHIQTFVPEDSVTIPSFTIDYAKLAEAIILEKSGSIHSKEMKK